MRMEIEPLLVSINQTAQIIGRCNATVYDLLGAGDLEARKSDGRTLVTMESIKRYVDSLPKAEIAPRPKRKPQHLREAETAKIQIAPPRRRKPQHLRQQAEAQTS
jgi:hypothetical protein